MISSVHPVMADILNFYFLALIIQVEVKIDNSHETSKDTVLANYIIEAALYDTGSWYNCDGNADLLSSNVANIKLNPSTTSLGFHGYVLVGRIEMPRLWSAEQVRELSSFRFLSHFILKLGALMLIDSGLLIIILNCNWVNEFSWKMHCHMSV